MLGFLKPRGELVEISGRTVVFLSSKAYRMDQKFEVKLGVPEPPGHTVTVSVRVLSCRPGPGDFFVVVSIAEGRRVPPEMKGYPIRNHPRARHRVTVKSEGLPGYRAVTHDLCRGGFGAELDGELPDGELLNVHLEFDEPVGWTLDLLAKVAWTVWKTQNRYETGFEFLEEPAYSLALEQLGAWLDQREQHELIPFKPPDKLPPRRPNQLVNQLPQADLPRVPAPLTDPKQVSPAVSEAQRAATPISSFDDDPTPLGLPRLVLPPPRPVALKLPQTLPLERPSAFQLQSPDPKAPAPEGPFEPRRTPSPAPFAMPSASSPPVIPIPVPSADADEDVGVRIHFQAHLRGWAWEAVDDSVVMVLEDLHGEDHWLEFPGCRGLQARCRQRDLFLKGMAVTPHSLLVSELTRENEAEPLMHYRFYDDHQRTVLDVVARECRQQVR